MKRNYLALPLIASCFLFACTARAQKSKSYLGFREQLKLSLRSNYKPVEIKSSIPKFNIGEKIGERGGFGVYKLPLDNMPCFKPKFRVENNFPVWYSPGDAHQIPNSLKHPFF